MVITAKIILLRSIQVNNNARFLWLNKEDKYQSKPLLIEEHLMQVYMISINFLNRTAVLILTTKLLRLLGLKETIIVLLSLLN